MVFGRAAEELKALLEHGIPYEVVPGVTTALAAASFAGIPFTHREFSSAVAFITGQEAPTQRGAVHARLSTRDLLGQLFVRRLH